MNIDECPDSCTLAYDLVPGASLQQHFQLSMSSLAQSSNDTVEQDSDPLYYIL